MEKLLNYKVEGDDLYENGEIELNDMKARYLLPEIDRLKDMK